MPNVVFKHNHGVLSHRDIRKLGEQAQPIVARYCSLPGMEFTNADIEWEPLENHPGAIMPDFCIDVNTYDFPERIAKLDDEQMLAFKAELAAVLLGFGLKQDFAWLWVRYVNQAGKHV